ncbi:DUF2612 domain-containing protein [Pseudomonas tohonis]|uniref:DUF2612 domain-containing protein n=1 Tax=Pseudomonas tohonis TaxID=2725477 RepID=UPI001F19B9FD|nr:DUF2612 domain-containing protein [Pseudomonas tohonis]
MAEPSDYSALITSEHNDKPKFVAMVELVAGSLADATNTATELPSAFDLDIAIGAQLDVIGLWVGISRAVKTPLAVYFAFDTEGLGFDQGAWRGPFDPDSGLTQLDDETYRTLIRAKIGANHWDGTLDGSKPILALVFAGPAVAFIEDNQDMSMTIGIAGQPPSALELALLTGGYIPIKPEGVRVNYITTTSPGPIFGFDVDNEFIAGFDESSWGAIYA